MDLHEITTTVRDHSPYEVVDVEADSGRVFVLLRRYLPKDTAAEDGFAVSLLQLDAAHDPAGMLRELTQKTVARLEAL